MSKFPLQPIVTDPDGKTRFRPNSVVQVLLDKGGLDLNTLHRLMPASEHREDWEQFAQLIGYSLSGFSELDYVSDDTYAVAKWISGDSSLTEEQARIAHLEELLTTARAHARELAGALFRIHPDDLRE